MKFHFLVGNDNGNSEHDIIIDGKLIQQPNVNCMVDKLPWNGDEDINLDKFVENIQDNLVVTINSPSAKPALYLIGKYALDSGEVVDNMQVGIDKKAEVELPIVNTLGHIAAVGVQKAYQVEKKIPKELEIVVDMATALPATQYYEKDAVDTFQKKFMKDSHYVTVHIGSSRTDIKITFDFVKVVPEGTPVIFALQAMKQDNFKELNSLMRIKDNKVFFEDIFQEFNELYGKVIGSNIDGSYFKDKKILHNDIGDGTTDYPVTHGQVFVRQFIYGSNHGAGHAIEEALPEFNELIHLPDSPRQYFSETLKNPGHKFHQKAIKTIRTPVQKQARQIENNIIRQLTKTRNDIDILATYGGGSILMRDALFQRLKQLCDEREIKLFYAPAKYAVILQVIGLYMFVKGDIYKALKKRAMEKLAGVAAVNKGENGNLQPDKVHKAFEGQK
jgi:plasmid segregation protein ParM